MDLTDDQQAATPVFQASPSESVHVSPRATKTFLPAKSTRLQTASASTEITLPNWELKTMEPIIAPTPLPNTEPSKSAPTRTAATKGSEEHTAHKATGSGATGGRGSAARGVPPPKIVSSFAPAYPGAARRARIEGTATVKVSVNTEGRVSDCSIFKSAGEASLDAAALRAVKNWRFTPADTNATEVLVRVTFRLS
jgi:protein TonB